MPDKQIDIFGVENNGDLILTNHGDAEMNSKSIFRKITWEIKDDSNTVRLILLESKSNRLPPFNDPLPTEYQNKIKLHVKYKHDDMDWDYCIKWKDKDGIVHNSDPIIAIRSSKKDEFIIPVITGLFIGLGIIGASVLFWKIKKK